MNKTEQGNMIEDVWKVGWGEYLLFILGGLGKLLCGADLPGGLRMRNYGRDCWSDLGASTFPGVNGGRWAGW